MNTEAETSTYSRHAAWLITGSLVYLQFPLLLFTYGWVRPIIAVPMLALIVTCAARLLISVWRKTRPQTFRPTKSDLVYLLAALVLVLAWVSLSGAGGIGFQNMDYVQSNSLLKDLIQNPWPLRLNLEDGRQGVPIVYYVGFLLPAALGGKIGGWTAANVVFGFWTLAGTLLAVGWFALLVPIAKSVRDLPWVVLIFALAGGMAAIGYLVVARQGFTLGTHLLWWSGIYQFSGNSTLLFWVPQQAIAGWIITGIVTFVAVENGPPRGVLFLGAPGLLFTPFSVVGLLPFGIAMLVALWRRNRLRELGPEDFLVAPLIGLLIASYIAANRFAFPSGWIWTTSDTYSPGRFALQWLLEIGVYAMLTWPWVRHASRGRRAWFLLSCICLTFIPLWKAGTFNDWAMRASIPALYVFWIYVAGAIADPTWRSRWPRVLVACFVVGSISAWSEMWRALEQFQTSPPAIENVGSFANMTGIGPDQRLGDPEAFFFRWLARR
jgi:hypothetical protein